ncbi:MAG: NAD(P)H-dependent oxidoreductase subunit E [Ignavibacteriales bacterium]|nr:NAD(P)H-dependent oxidoreductase subunit E [Ignavibacteriales bacterium]
MEDTITQISETAAPAKRSFEKICKILDNHFYRKEELIPILQEVQSEYRFLPKEVLTFIAHSLDVPTAHVFGVATFYTHFALKAKGKYIVKVCDGTACHVKSSLPIIQTIQQKLRLNDKKNTTDDMLFTLEMVSCLGACGIAPVVVVNDDVHSLMTPSKTEEVLDTIINFEEQEAVNNG